MHEFLPLTEATFFILLSLAQEAKHGYAIMKDVEALSMERVQFSTGTLYGALKRLLEQGWIMRKADDSPTNQRDQKTYELTDIGRRILSAETQRLQSVLNAARLRLRQDNT
ncbi:MAG: helix-turn-helix transcriptional regulator [Anaerolineae bacterium]